MKAPTKLSEDIASTFREEGRWEMETGPLTSYLLDYKTGNKLDYDGRDFLYHTGLSHAEGTYLYAQWLERIEEIKSLERTTGRNKLVLAYWRPS